ncbi:MAG: beta-lactamase family protein [Gemmatimonadetes bacterium]|nr:beta-lactamase family protein [Gemmatimonadota bacterium]
MSLKRTCRAPRPERGALARCRLLAQALAVVPALLFAVSAHAQSAAWYSALDRFRERIRQDVAADGVGGVTAAVVVGDRTVWAEGFGWADPERRIPAGVETIYRIGSISKSVTAVALMQLVERGVLGLDEPVEKHLPAVRGFANPRAGSAPITFRQLASHTAGIIREPRLDGAASGPIEVWEDKILASIPATSFDTVPGARYSYSNIGFGVLGLAISRAAGRPFMELVTEEIFRPLGMTRTAFIVPHDWLPDLAVGHASREDGTVDLETPAREHRGRGYKVPNGGVYTTVLDLGRFVAGMTGAAGGRILRAESRAEMMRIHTPESPTDGYGIGFFVRTAEDGIKLVAHSGSLAGYNAYIAFDPESRVGVILLRNYNHGTSDLGEAASGLLLELVRAGGLAAAGPH